MSEVAQYLEQWHSQSPQWKFKKLVQEQLLASMYKIDVLSKEEFKIAILYLRGIKGAAKERMIQRAKEIVAEFERKHEAGEEVDDEERRAVKRAVKLLDDQAVEEGA